MQLIVHVQNNILFKIMFRKLTFFFLLGQQIEEDDNLEHLIRRNILFKAIE